MKVKIEVDDNVMAKLVAHVNHCLECGMCIVCVEHGVGLCSKGEELIEKELAKKFSSPVMNLRKMLERRTTKEN